MDVGRLVATLQLAGAAAFGRDAKNAEDALDKVGDAAEKAGESTDKLADAQEKEAAASDKSAAASEKSAEKTLTAAQAKKAAEKAAKEQAEAEAAAAEKIGKAMVLTGTAILAMSAVAVSKYAEFDQAMSEVQATVQGNVETQHALREAAIEAGGATSFSAKEAAQAENELAKAGVGVRDILNGGLAGSLALAAAGQLSVAEAAEVAATALVQFNLKGSQVPHVADLLAAGAGKAQGSVRDLAQALNQGGLVASQMGLSVEETTGTLSAFAAAGLIGSDSGTSFKTMLLSLANPSTQARKAMDQYNISAYDAQGNMVSMTDLAGQLESKLGNLTQAERDKALATIFGSDAIRAANVLYVNGAGGIQGWIDKVNDAGYAARVAAELQNNLAGDTEKLGGAFDSAFIKSGAAANDVMREMVQMLTFLVNAYGELPEGMQQAVMIGGAVVGMLTLTGGAALLAVPKIVAFREALALIGPASSGARGGLKSIASFMLGPWGVAFAAATLAVGVFVAQQKRIDDATNDIAGTLDQATGAMTDYTEQTIRKKLADDDVFAAAKKAGIGQDELTAAIRNGGAALDDVLAKMSKTNTIGTFFTGQGIAAGNASDRIRELASGVEKAQDRFQQLNEKTDVTSAQQNGLAAATDGATSSFNDMSYGAEDVAKALDGLMEQIDAYNKQQNDVVQSNADFLLSLDSLGNEVDSLKKSWDSNHEANEQWIQSLDQSTASGAQQAAMLSDQAQKAIAAAKAQYEVDKTTMSAKDASDKYSATLASNRQRLEDAAVAAGYNRDEVRQLLDTIAAAPSQKVTNMVANTAQAKSSVDIYVSALNQIPGYKAVVIDQVIRQTGASRGEVGAAYNADGNVYSSVSRGQLVKAFANGGVENHVAQFAAGGTYRVWAEDETEGETYLPHAKSKRARTEALMAQTADIFGGRYISAAEMSAAGAGGGAAAGPMRITGTLDLGGGLHGFVDGIVQSAITEQNDEAAKGTRRV